jgi:hypothetical protein
MAEDSIFSRPGGFVPEGQHGSSQVRSARQLGHLERGARGDLCPAEHRLEAYAMLH